MTYYVEDGTVLELTYFNPTVHDSLIKRLIKTSGQKKTNES